MKYLSEFRDPELAEQYLTEIKIIATRPWTIMEVCGGQTHSLVKNGLLGMLGENIRMVHGPGCPVCVTPLNLIDKAIFLTEERNVILCSFGDMLRVPGSKKNLLQSKANGADVRIMYSPLDAVKLAQIDGIRGKHLAHNAAVLDHALALVTAGEAEVHGGVFTGAHAA